MIAAGNGHVATVALLLDHHANIDAAIQIEGYTSLLFAIFSNQIDVVKLLLQRNANINLPAYDGVTPLIAASTYGHLDLVRILLQAGTNISSTDVQGRNALTIAEQNGYQEIADDLRRGPILSARKTFSLQIICIVGACALGIGIFIGKKQAVASMQLNSTHRLLKNQSIELGTSRPSLTKNNQSLSSKRSKKKTLQGEQKCESNKEKEDKEAANHAKFLRRKSIITERIKNTREKFNTASFSLSIEKTNLLQSLSEKRDSHDIFHKLIATFNPEVFAALDRIMEKINGLNGLIASSNDFKSLQKLETILEEQIEPFGENYVRIQINCTSLRMQISSLPDEKKVKKKKVSYIESPIKTINPVEMASTININDFKNVSSLTEPSVATRSFMPLKKRHLEKKQIAVSLNKSPRVTQLNSRMAHFLKHKKILDRLKTQATTEIKFFTHGSSQNFQLMNCFPVLIKNILRGTLYFTAHDLAFIFGNNRYLKNLKYNLTHHHYLLEGVSVLKISVAILELYEVILTLPSEEKSYSSSWFETLDQPGVANCFNRRWLATLKEKESCLYDLMSHEGTMISFPNKLLYSGYQIKSYANELAIFYGCQVSQAIQHPKLAALINRGGCFLVALCNPTIQHDPQLDTQKRNEMKQRLEYLKNDGDSLRHTSKHLNYENDSVPAKNIATVISPQVIGALESIGLVYSINKPNRLSIGKSKAATNNITNEQPQMRVTKNGK